MMLRFKDFYTISNLLSLLRLFMAIPFWVLLDASHHGVYDIHVILLALLAGVTDILDGFLARKLNQVTEAGKLIDPLADKVCVAAIFIQLFLSGRLDAFIFGLVIARDILILLAGLFISPKLKRILPSNMLGKVTVLIICFYILAILSGINEIKVVNYLFRYSIMIFTVASLVGYAMRAAEFLKQTNNETI